MADTEKSLLYVGLGFFVTLYIMSHFTVLRPKTLTLNELQSQSQSNILTIR